MTRREARDFISSHNWRFAKTMPKWPHWYVVRRYCRREDEWLEFMRLIRNWGYDEKFHSMNIRYLDLDGFKYWTNGYIEEHTSIINRAELKGWEYETPWTRNPVPLKLKLWSRCAPLAGGEDYLSSENYKVKAVRVRKRL